MRPAVGDPAAPPAPLGDPRRPTPADRPYAPAPRDPVYACPTTPEHVTHVRGPDGTHTPVGTIVVDLRPGGMFEITMVDDRSGDTYTMRAVYLEGATEVVTVQRGLPPHMRTPQARAGQATALQRAAAYIAAPGGNETP